MCKEEEEERKRRKWQAAEIEATAAAPSQPARLDVSRSDHIPLVNFILYCFDLLCTGRVSLNTDAPSVTVRIRLGVFAVNENISLLLQASKYFLPTCTHNSGIPALNLTLSKINNGPIWVQEAAVPDRTGRLVPSSPPLLQPNQTGQYHCTSPGLQPSEEEYRLKVVGKKESKFEHFLFLFCCVGSCGASTWCSAFGAKCCGFNF